MSSGGSPSGHSARKQSAGGWGIELTCQDEVSAESKTISEAVILHTAAGSSSGAAAMVSVMAG